MYSNNGMFQPFHVESTWSLYGMDGVHVESMWNEWSPCGVHVESIWNPSSFHVESMWTFHHSMWNLAIPSPFHVESRWNGEPKTSGIPAKHIPYEGMESMWNVGGSKDLLAYSFQQYYISYLTNF